MKRSKPNISAESLASDETSPIAPDFHSGAGEPVVGVQSRKPKSNKGNRFGVHHGDARQLVKTLEAQTVDVTITSPPYFDLKDYGVANQVGFGQDYETYLSDLAAIFGGVFRATKDAGSLWIIIDTFRRDHEVFALPFDLVAKLKNVGWVLRDVIIWKKDRTVPWTHKGTTKRIFEYILVLAKTKQDFRYFPDRYRETSELKEWWVRYPERYNPRGKALEEVWNFNIPKQGSWGDKYIRHFCPLPSELVSRIINLTTSAGDVVLDPFSGSGAVLAQAAALDRKYIGFEINRRYITMFGKHLLRQDAKRSSPSHDLAAMRSTAFERLIIDLRVLKYARLLYRAAAKLLGKDDVRIFVRRLDVAPKQARQLVVAEYIVLVTDASVRKKLQKHLADISGARPLSKFGVEAHLKVVRDGRSFSPYKRKVLYTYSSIHTHKYSARMSFDRARKTEFPIVSTIKVKVESPGGY